MKNFKMSLNIIIKYNHFRFNNQGPKCVKSAIKYVLVAKIGQGQPRIISWTSFVGHTQCSWSLSLWFRILKRFGTQIDNTSIY